MQCDERLPKCTNCVFRNVPCLYRQGVTPLRESRSSSEASEEESLPSPAGLTRSRPIQPLFSEFFRQLPTAPFCNASVLANSLLLSEYCQHASVGIAAAGRTDRKLEVYRDVIPSIGFRHQVVSEAIYAVAALFLCITQLRELTSRTEASHRSNGPLSKGEFDHISRSFLHQARIHHAKCLRALRDEVHSLGKHNSDAVLACSVLLLPYSLASSQLDRHRMQLSEGQSESYDSAVRQQSFQCRGCHQNGNQLLDLSWFHFTLGLTTLLATVFRRSFLDRSPMLPLFQWTENERVVLDDFLPLHIIQSGTQYQGDSAVLRHHLLPTVLADGPGALDRVQLRLLALRSPQATSRSHWGQTPQQVEVCLQSLRCLKLVVQNFTASATASRPSPYFRILAEWVSRTERQFLDLLAEENIMALAVYAHFLVHMILVEDLWFVGDLGIATVRSILSVVYGCSLCGKSPDGLNWGQQELIAWPARIAKLYYDVA